MLATGSAVKESFVVCQSSSGVELRATLLRLNRFCVAFELYNPGSVLRLSEVLSDLRILVRDRTLYSGRGVVRSLVNTGLVLVCEATLDEASWTDVDFAPAMAGNGHLRQEFATFIQEWQSVYRVRQEYKVVIADLQSFLSDLRLWLEQVELGIRAAPSGDRVLLEQQVAEQVAQPVVPAVNVFFEKLENLSASLDEESRPAHWNYIRRQLHPWVLSSPFAHRAFYKPLGYAGDYELVNMMARNAQEGGSLYAKVVNTWFLQQAPAAAHRNRIRYLEDALLRETSRVLGQGREPRVFNVACGPAREIQNFLKDHPVSSRANFTLLDFNQETLDYTRSVLTEIRTRYSRIAPIQYTKKSVQQVLKESGRTIERPPDQQYDFVYCAGLFDYLSDPVCRRLTGVMYDWLAPGGLLVVTNVEPSNPLRFGMEHLLDWHLVYRTADQLRGVKPPQADEDSVAVTCDDTGVNLFLAARKPLHG